MKRVLIPISLLRTEEDRLTRILRTMGPEVVEFRLEATNGDPALGDPAFMHSSKRALVVTVPDDMSLHWVERMVAHALRDASLNPQMGRLMTLG